MRRRTRLGRGSAWALLLTGVLVIGLAVWLTRRADDPVVSSPTTTAPAPTRPAPAPTLPAPAPTTATGRCAEPPVAGIPAQPGVQRPLPTLTAARTMLAALKTAPRDRGDDFCRAAFGPSTWPDLDRNGCSTRQDVLKRSGTDLHTARIKANGGTCEEVIAGTWVDAYTGARLTFTDLKNPSQAEQLQIDHLVSLFNAWVSGARSWAPERRVRFAQDLTTHELYAVSGAENFTKAYRGIESWQPGDPYRCAVARSYIEVKSIWGLTVTAPERDALASLMATCAPS